MPCIETGQPVDQMMKHNQRDGSRSKGQGEDPLSDGRDQDEGELIKAAVLREQWAIEELVRRYQKRAYAIALRICSGDAEEARDLTQEAFLNVFRHIKNFEGKSSFYTWFYRVVINTCLSALRQRERRPRLSSLWRLWKGSRGETTERMEDPPDEHGDSDPLSMLGRKQLKDEIHKALVSLSEKQRMVFDLKVFEEMSIEEIARTMNIAEGTVKSHLFRATRHVREALSDWERE